MTAIAAATSAPQGALSATAQSAPSTHAPAQGQSAGAAHQPVSAVHPTGFDGDPLPSNSNTNEVGNRLLDAIGQHQAASIDRKKTEQLKQSQPTYIVHNGEIYTRSSAVMQ